MPTDMSGQLAAGRDSNATLAAAVERMTEELAVADATAAERFSQVMSLENAALEEAEQISELRGHLNACQVELAERQVQVETQARRDPVPRAASGGRGGAGARRAGAGGRPPGRPEHASGAGRGRARCPAGRSRHPAGRARHPAGPVRAGPGRAAGQAPGVPGDPGRAGGAHHRRRDHGHDAARRAGRRHHLHRHPGGAGRGPAAGDWGAPGAP
jgi:hypothetical protein